MKAIAIFLAFLAAAKLGYQEYLFRIAARDALVAAYKVHAVEACQRDTKSHNFGISPQAWANPKAIRLVIGKSSLDVYPWQIDHAKWDARYRNPYLVLTAAQRSGDIACEYDINNAAASISRI
jgi:hypothetical protein